MEKLYSYPIEFKSNLIGEFEGYASVFGIVDHHNDIIRKGAFSDIKKPSDVKLLWQHNQEEPIGYFTEIFENNLGLYVKGKIIVGTIKGREAYELVKSQAIEGLSIGFDTEHFHFDDQGRRIISKLKLWEVSLVTFPSNERAKVLSLKNCDKNNAAIRAINALWGVPGGRY